MLYNEALKKVTGVTATYNRTLDSATISVGDRDILADELAGSFNSSNVPITNITLASLSSAYLTSYQVEEVGNQYVMTMLLKDAWFVSNSCPYSVGGYLHFLRGEEVLGNVKLPSLGVGGEFQWSEIATEFTGGQLIVTIDAWSGKLSNMKLSVIERIEATIKNNLGRGKGVFIDRGIVTYLVQ